MFDRIEDSNNDLTKKEKACLLYNLFNPVVSNQEDKYYPYECAFDFEAMLKKKLKIMKRNYKLYLNMCP